MFLSPDTITAVVDGFTRGAIPDYQMSAWLMAVTCRGMDFAEVVALTRAYVDSGSRLELGLGGFVVDKHSTGGVGDKTTLVVVPLLASLGIPVAKMSGRGLDFAGGTLDKLESIPGLRLALSAAEMRDVLGRTGMTIVAQTADLVPADGATYALRDVTGTVESFPLIAASIMSKKIAAGTAGVVLDVKFGRGALTGDLGDAEELARLMIRVGAVFGLSCRAVLSDMNAPLGAASGNALEVREALDVLRGRAVPGLTELCCALAAEAIQLAGLRIDREEARRLAAEHLRSGRALPVFREWVRAQGGDADVVDRPERLPSAPVVDTVTADADGWVHDIDARAIGLLGLRLGAGRTTKGAPIDRAVGVVLRCRIGDRVEAGQPLADVHWQGGTGHVRNDIRTAVRIARDRPRVEPVVRAVVSGEDVPAGAHPARS